LSNATGAERLQIRRYDLLVHGWDLGQATGIPARMPDDLAEQAPAFARGQLSAQLSRPDAAVRVKIYLADVEGSPTEQCHRLMARLRADRYKS
jgi:hypothetical protein